MGNGAANRTAEGDHAEERTMSPNPEERGNDERNCSVTSSMGLLCHCHARQNRLYFDAQKGCSYLLLTGELQSWLTEIYYNITIVIREVTLELVYHA